MTESNPDEYAALRMSPDQKAFRDNPWMLNRRTGRTTAMLKHAYLLKNLGHEVIVVFPLEGQAKFFQNEHPQLRIESSNRRDFDWDTQTFRGFGGVVLLDHSAYEHRMEQLSRFAKSIVDLAKELPL